MTTQQHEQQDARALAEEAANGDLGRVILVSPTIILVVNRPGFDPYTWPKKTWRKAR
jgi:hypothetical protein